MPRCTTLVVFLLLFAAPLTQAGDNADPFPAQDPNVTTDKQKVFALRYLRQIHGHWHVGPQFFSTDFAISADDALTGNVLDEIGLTGFTSMALGRSFEWSYV